MSTEENQETSNMNILNLQYAGAEVYLWKSCKNLKIDPIRLRTIIYAKVDNTEPFEL